MAFRRLLWNIFYKNLIDSLSYSSILSIYVLPKSNILKEYSMRHVGLVILIAAVIALVGMSGRPTNAADTPAAAKVRIGVYDSRAVALAYGRSKAFNEFVKDKMAKHKAAKDSNDVKAAKEIEKQMESLQDKMHWQVFSDWNVDDVLVQIRPNYLEIARKAGVVAIVPRVEFKDAGVEQVDVTTQMIEQFRPDEQTMKIIKDMAAKPPLSFEEMRKVKTSD
jgi:hypothetical protein